MANLLWIIALVLVAVWAIAVFFKVIGGLIHLLLVVAVVVVVFNLLRRKTGIGSRR